MASVFKPTSQIVQEMCDEYKSITGIQLDPTNVDDSTVNKFMAYAGTISSFTATLQQTIDDFFPASASTEALIKHLAARSLPTRIGAQPSHGVIQFSGNASGIVIPIGTQVKRVSDGAVFKTIQAGATNATTYASLFVESVLTGNSQNLDSLNQPFTLVTAVAGISSSCTNTSLLLDGRDIESAEEMVARIQAHDQDDNSGGNVVAYESWARRASNQVVTAKTIRIPRGPDTVDTYITAGTADIAAAVQSGQPVTRLPSADLLATVQAFIIALNPTTDDHQTKAPVELPFNVTFRFSLIEESSANRAYVSDVILKVIKTYIYIARPKDVLSPTSIERLVDQAIGELILERSCDNLGGANTYYVVPETNILTPNVISILSL